MTTHREELVSLSEQAKALLADEDELETLEQRVTTSEQRALMMETQANNLTKQRVKSKTQENSRLQEIGAAIKQAQLEPAYLDADQALKDIKSSSGIDDLTVERKQIRQDIAKEVAEDQEIQYLREQAADIRAEAETVEERISRLRVRNRAASRNIVEQAALIVQLPLL